MGNSGPLTHKERILLLLKKVDYEGEYVAPHLLCQDGISDALDMLKNNVSRELSTLKDDDLVKEELSRVKGLDRRRKIFLLTDKGEETAQEIENELKEEEISIQDDKRKKITIKNAIELLGEESPNITPFDIEEWMRKKEVLIPEEFESPFIKGSEEENVEMIVNDPAKGDFYGRDEEKEKILSSLEEEVPPLVTITGIAGIGKSSLGTMIMEELDRDILWYSFHPWDSREDFSEVLRDFCVRAGFESLETDASLPECTNEFIQRISGMRPVLFLDDCEKMPEEIRVFLELVLEHKKSGEDLALVLMGRKKMDFYDVRDVMEDQVLEVELGPLNIEAVEEIVGSTSEAENIYEMTEGHPLYVELAERYTAEHTHMNEFIEKEIYSKLEENEKEVMRRLSVFWKPVEKEAVLEERETEVLLELKDRDLIDETREGKVTMHTILKNFFYEHMSREKKQKFHLRAAEISGDKGKDLEELRHLEKAGEWKKSLKKMKELVPLIASLNDSVRREIIEDLPEVPEEKKAEYHEILGDIYLESEEWVDALNQYESAIHRGKDTTAIREKLGEAQMKMEKWKETIESHESALNKYKEKNDEEGMIREYLSLGTVYRRKGDWEEAERYYERVKDMIVGNGPNKIESTLYNNKAMLHLSRNELKKAEELFKKALDSGGEKPIIYENLSLLFEKRGRVERSLEYLEKAVEGYLDQEKKNDAVDLLIESAERYKKIDEMKKAEQYLKRAIDIEEEHREGFFGKEKMTIREVRAHDKLADVMSGKDWKGCLNHRMKAVKGYTEIGEKEKSYRTKLKYAFDLHDSGRAKEALKKLKDLKKKLKREQMIKGVNACEFEEARIYREKGEYEKARKILEEIKDRSEKKGDERAKQNAEEMLDSILEKMGRK